MKKKKKTNAESSGGPGWLCTFNDLMTLLMVFFVMLFTMGSLDVKKLKRVQQSLQSGLGVLKEGQKVSVRLIEPQSSSEVKSVLEKEDIAAIQHVIEPQSPSEVKSVTTQEESVNDVPDKILDIIKVFDSEPAITAIYMENGVLITLSSTILFQFGSADINPESFFVLDKIVAEINKMSESVRVEGHTDNIPVVHSRRFPSNWELSIKRAVNVVKYFVEVGKISPQRLSAVGYGESKPLFPNDTQEHRDKNRRVEILVEMEEED